VIPYRSAPDGTCEIFWVRRSESLRFMGGWHAFPGGRLSETDGAVPATGSVDGMDAYDRSGQRLLIPRGTRALGEALQVEAWEQSRLAVTFHRLILPDGRGIRLDQSAALNQIGETGLLDLVDRRYPSAFLAAGAIGALAGLSSAVSPTQALVSRFGAARQSVGAGLSQSAERMLDRYLNRLPKLTIREGHRIRIYLTADLTVRPYHDPPGPRAGPAFEGESQ